ncbi:MAG: flippase-like domain-containing protein, partial [Planctomycetes bacterium]|nr:flippase-like domain-containing protein [Planctomycetota bacterium]
MKNKLVLILKIVCVPIILLFFYTTVDWRETLHVLKGISIPLGMAALLVAITDRVLVAYKWSILIKAYDIDNPWYAPYDSVFRGKVLMLFTPSSIGIDVYKTYYMKKFGGSLLSIVSSITVERLVGAFSSLAIIALLLYFSIKPIHPDIALVSGLCGLLGFLMICIMIWYLTSHATKLQCVTFPFFIPLKFKRMLAKFIKNVTSISTKKSSVYYYFTVSVIEKLFYGTAVYFSVRSLGINDIPYTYLIAATPLMAMAERLPVSFSSIGFREGLFVGLLYPYYHDVSYSVSVALVLRAVDLI